MEIIWILGMSWIIYQIVYQSYRLSPDTLSWLMGMLTGAIVAAALVFWPKTRN